MTSLTRRACSSMPRLVKVSDTSVSNVIGTPGRFFLQEESPRTNDMWPSSDRSSFALPTYENILSFCGQSTRPGTPAWSIAAW